MNDSLKIPLSKITQKILKSPSDLTSIEFIQGYNIIYEYCTVITSDYEIRGRPVYDLLHDVINNYTTECQIACSVNDFVAQSKLFELSLSLISKMYSYLERYFIQVSIERRDTYVQDIETLMYSFYYRNYIERVEQTLLKMLLFGVEISRNGDDDSLSELAYAIQFYRKLLAYSDEMPRYDHLIKLYILEFKEKLKKIDCIKEIVSCINNELIRCIKIFDLDPNRLDKTCSKLVAGCTSRADEMVRYAMERIKAKKDAYSVIRILELCGGGHILRLFQRYQQFMDGVLSRCKTFEEVSSAFKFFSQQIEQSFKDDPRIRTAFFQKFKNFVIDKKNEEIFTREHIINVFDKEIDRVIKEKNGKIDTFLSFASTLDINIYDQLITSQQKRLLFDQSDKEEEKKLLNELKNIAPYECIIKGKRSIKDITNTFKIGEDITVKRLTKGLWNLESENLVLHPLLEESKIQIEEISKIKYPKSLISLCLSVSPIIITINGFDIRLSTDKASLLLFLEEENEEEILMSLTKDDNLIEKLLWLESKKLIYRKDGKYFINNDISESMDVFEDKYEVPIIDDSKLGVGCKINILEANVMRYMKKAKSSTIEMIYEEMISSGLEEYLTDGVNQVIKVVDVLINKDYLMRESENIIYIP
ncbi:hypothetical protein TCON_1242 [Astathelohania contejeani]|uniref:Cullin family profile domain-containing protein n=1 Tax=Astathelohania contejeani TaxID=164912 RepID=A0ABQ7HZF7_9MICR|nr:hypothetical protein TCON_1242 [Thelohania contejeani]